MSKTDVDLEESLDLVKLYTKVEINDGDGGRKLSNILECYLAYFSVRNASSTTIFRDNVQWTHFVSKLFLNDNKTRSGVLDTNKSNKMSGKKAKEAIWYF